MSSRTSGRRRGREACGATAGRRRERERLGRVGAGFSGGEEAFDYAFDAGDTLGQGPAGRSQDRQVGADSGGVRLGCSRGSRRRVSSKPITVASTARVVMSSGRHGRLLRCRSVSAPPLWPQRQHGQREVLRSLSLRAAWEAKRRDDYPAEAPVRP